MKLNLFSKLMVSLASLAPVLVACACSEDSADAPAVAPRLTSSAPADGATDVKITTDALTLVYDQPVRYLASASPITINGVAAASNWSKPDMKSIEIKGLDLARGCTYTVSIPQGAVVASEGGAEAAAATISFSTEAEKEVNLATAPVVPNASAEAQKLFSFLRENYGKKYVTAAMANVNWNFAEAELVKKATGKYPAVAVMDYIHMFASAPGAWIDYSKTEAVEQWWQNNGLIAASWHWMAPAAEGDTKNFVYEPDKTSFRAKNIFVEGTWEQKQADADLAKMADLLLLLQKKNIPVIWRPLHEAAGNTYNFPNGKAWFWWGYDGAEVYVKLWRKMFDYFNSRGLNNLIWVWTSQTSNPKNHDEPYYPGDEYVDIVGCDIYHAQQTNTIVAQRDEMQSLWPNKMLILSECGDVATMPAQWKAGATWGLLMPWYQYNAATLDGHEHADTQWWKTTMADERAIAREDMPSLK